MRRVFVDTSYYLALLLKNDDLRAEARAFDDRASGLRMFTTDAVFMEILAHVAARGTHLRAGALELIESVRTAQNVTVVRQTPQLFDEALALYRLRPDKAYSLVDCMSMIVCRQMEIAEVLTHDRHFHQEGFTILL